MKLFVLFVFFVTILIQDKTEANSERFLVPLYYEVPLDHFSPEPKRKFPLKVLINGRFHVKGGPIFVYPGGNHDIWRTADSSEFLFDIAPIFNAALVFIEHRYYGESLPFGNASFYPHSNLIYLSSRQALADFAYLIPKIKKQLNKGIENKSAVIAFGGYYSGVLASSLRKQYPYLVNGAIASSAPTGNFVGLITCEGVYQRVTSIYEQFGTQKCVKIIKRLFNLILKLYNNNPDYYTISKGLNLCTPLNSPKDVLKLQKWLENLYVKLSLVNYPYPSNYLAKVPSYPVKAFCESLNTASLTDPIKIYDAYAEAFGIFTNFTGSSKCNEINEDYNELAFQYQLCFDLIMPKCSTEKDMFITKPWSFEVFQEECMEKFGFKAPHPNLGEIIHGGNNLRGYTNLLMVSNDMDPYSWGAPDRNNSKYYKNSDDVLFYNFTAPSHIMDLRGTEISDNFYITRAREYYITVLKKWLNMD